MALPESRNTTYNPNDPTLTSDLNDIQDQIVTQFARFQPVQYTPTIVGVDVADISVNRCFWRLLRTPTPSFVLHEIVELILQLTFNNTVNDPASNALDIEIALPWQAADHTSLPNPPVSSTKAADPVASVWPDQTTDRAIQGWVTHIGTSDTLKIQRISTTNSTPGFVLVGNTGRQLLLHGFRFWTNGVGLP